MLKAVRRHHQMMHPAVALVREVRSQAGVEQSRAVGVPALIACPSRIHAAMLSALRPVRVVCHRGGARSIHTRSPELTPSPRFARRGAAVEQPITHICIGDPWACGFGGYRIGTSSLVATYRRRRRRSPGTAPNSECARASSGPLSAALESRDRNRPRRSAGEARRAATDRSTQRHRRDPSWSCAPGDFPVGTGVDHIPRLRWGRGRDDPALGGRSTGPLPVRCGGPRGEVESPGGRSLAVDVPFPTWSCCDASATSQTFVACR